MTFFEKIRDMVVQNNIRFKEELSITVKRLINDYRMNLTLFLFYDISHDVMFNLDKLWWN